jgi:hypothetical protein
MVIEGPFDLDETTSVRRDKLSRHMLCTNIEFQYHSVESSCQPLKLRILLDHLLTPPASLDT